jgi:hypothetical protein
MDRSIQFFYSTLLGKDIYLYSLRNINKTEVLISNYGAIVMTYKIMRRMELQMILFSVSIIYRIISALII